LFSRAFPHDPIRETTPRYSGQGRHSPIFFHWRRSADRTGMFAALYRVTSQKWDPKKAYDEARDIGMRWFYSGLKSQILGLRQ
jgi:hypothetical protein